MNYMVIEKEIRNLLQRPISKFLIELLVLVAKNKNEPTTQPSFISLVIEGNGQDSNIYNIRPYYYETLSGSYMNQQQDMWLGSRKFVLSLLSVDNTV